MGMEGSIHEFREKFLWKLWAINTSGGLRFSIGQTWRLFLLPQAVDISEGRETLSSIQSIFSLNFTPEVVFT